MAKRLLRSLFFGAALLWTGSAALDPDLHLCRRVRPGKWRQCSPIARLPTPADKIVIRYVIKQFFERAAAILFGILDLPAQCSRRTSHKHHFLSRRGARPLYARVHPWRRFRELPN